MTQPKAIFFDLDETLIENTVPIPKIFAAMYAPFENQLGSGYEELFFAALRAEAGTVWGRMFEVDETPEEQLKNCFRKAIGAVLAGDQETLTEEMYQRFVGLTRQHICFQQGAESTLQGLREAGFITGVITNGIEELQMGKIRAMQIESKVDHVIVSAQARAHKPDAKVFALALERSGVSPGQAWQIGDHATNDVAGAIRAGMSGIFYDPEQSRYPSAFDDLDEKPTHVIHQLQQVLSLAGVTPN